MLSSWAKVSGMFSIFIRKDKLIMAWEQGYINTEGAGVLGEFLDTLEEGRYANLSSFRILPRPRASPASMY